MGEVASNAEQTECRRSQDHPKYIEKDSSSVCPESKGFALTAMVKFVFGWTKASKCKKVIKKAQYRLNERKTKTGWRAKLMRNDVEALIRLGASRDALERAGRVYEDESHIFVCELLDQYCEQISFNFSLIRRNMNCPEEIKEAVSSLMFASTKCNLPDLLQLQRLFGSRYGKRFKTEALKGKHVNIQIIEKLSIGNLSDEVKYGMLKEISKNFSRNPVDSEDDVESSSGSSTIDEDIQELKSPFNKSVIKEVFSSPHQIIDDIDMEISARRSSVSSVDENSMPLSGDDKTMDSE